MFGNDTAHACIHAYHKSGVGEFIDNGIINTMPLGVQKCTVYTSAGQKRADIPGKAIVKQGKRILAVNIDAGHVTGVKYTC